MPEYIYDLYYLATHKINFIDFNVQNHAVKNNFVLPNEIKYLMYKDFVNLLEQNTILNPQHSNKKVLYEIVDKIILRY